MTPSGLPVVVKRLETSPTVRILPSQDPISDEQIKHNNNTNANHSQPHRIIGLYATCKSSTIEGNTRNVNIPRGSYLNDQFVQPGNIGSYTNKTSDMSLIKHKSLTEKLRSLNQKCNYTLHKCYDTNKMTMDNDLRTTNKADKTKVHHVKITSINANDRACKEKPTTRIQCNLTKKSACLNVSDDAFVDQFLNKGQTVRNSNEVAEDANRGVHIIDNSKDILENPWNIAKRRKTTASEEGPCIVLNQTEATSNFHKLARETNIQDVLYSHLESFNSHKTLQTSDCSSAYSAASLNHHYNPCPFPQATVLSIPEGSSSSFVTAEMYALLNQFEEWANSEENTERNFNEPEFGAVVSDGHNPPVTPNCGQIANVSLLSHKNPVSFQKAAGHHTNNVTGASRDFVDATHDDVCDDDHRHHDNHDNNDDYDEAAVAVANLHWT